MRGLDVLWYKKMKITYGNYLEFPAIPTRSPLLWKYRFKNRCKPKSSKTLPKKSEKIAGTTVLDLEILRQQKKKSSSPRAAKQALAKVLTQQHEDLSAQDVADAFLPGLPPAGWCKGGKSAAKVPLACAEVQKCKSATVVFGLCRSAILRRAPL